MFDKEKLIKLISLTTSEHDGEALSALRKANTLLKQNKLTWREILVYEHKATYSIKQDENEVKLKLLINDKRIKGKTREFILSLSQTHLKYGRLTEKQEAALVRIFLQYYKKD